MHGRNQRRELMIIEPNSLTFPSFPRKAFLYIKHVVVMIVDGLLCGKIDLPPDDDVSLPHLICIMAVISQVLVSGVGLFVGTVFRSLPVSPLKFAKGFISMLFLSTATHVMFSVSIGMVRNRDPAKLTLICVIASLTFPVFLLLYGVGLADGNLIFMIYISLTVKRILRSAFETEASLKTTLTKAYTAIIQIVIFRQIRERLFCDF